MNRSGVFFKDYMIDICRFNCPMTLASYFSHLLMDILFLCSIIDDCTLHKNLFISPGFQLSCLFIYLNVFVCL